MGSHHTSLSENYLLIWVIQFSGFDKIQFHCSHIIPFCSGITQTELLGWLTVIFADTIKGGLRYDDESFCVVNKAALYSLWQIMQVESKFMPGNPYRICGNAEEYGTVLTLFMTVSKNYRGHMRIVLWMWSVGFHVLKQPLLHDKAGEH